MSFVNSFQFEIGECDRIQIKCQTNFSIDVAREMMAIRPIEVTVTPLNNNKSLFNITAPSGFTAAVLGQDEADKAYYADIENQFYKHLVVDADGAQSTWMITAGDLTNRTLGLLYSQPIVFKAFIRAQGVSSVLIAANEKFLISRSNQNKFGNVVHNADEVHESILRLIEIVDEPLPEKRTSLELLLGRLDTTIKVLEKYASKKLTLKAKEDIAYGLAEVRDYQDKVNIKIAETRHANVFDALLHQKILEKLKQALGSARFEKSLSGIYREIFKELKQQEREEKIINGNGMYDALLNEVETYGKREHVKRILDAELPKHLFAHSCSKCGSDAVEYVDDEKKHVYVKCSKCSNIIPANKSSKKRTTSVINWNMINAVHDIDCWLTFLSIEPMGDDELDAFLKQVQTIMMAILAYGNKNFNTDFRKNRAFVNIQETSEVVKSIKSIISKARSSG